MVKTLFIGIAGTVALIFIWIIVQYYWGKQFFHSLTDVDVLASRNNCGNCSCPTACEDKRHGES